MSSIQRSDRGAFFARSVIENDSSPVRSHDNGHTEDHTLLTAIIVRRRGDEYREIKITAESIGPGNLKRIIAWIALVESGNAPHGKRAYVLTPTDLAALTPGTRRIAMSGNAVAPLRTQKWRAEQTQQPTPSQQRSGSQFKSEAERRRYEASIAVHKQEN